MLYPTFDYIEYAYNGANKRGQVVKASELNVPKDGADHYLNIYRYQAEIVDWLAIPKEKRSRHDFFTYCDYIYFDIDQKDDLELAAGYACQLVEQIKLFDIPADKIKVSFSGSKGFHVLIPTSLFGAAPSKDFNYRIKAIVLNIAQDIPVDTGIYDNMRLFRIPNTVNSKTGLYKVDLSHDMLGAEISTILDYAKKPQPIIKVENNCATRDHLKALWDKAARKEQKQENFNRKQVEIPKNQKACICRILQGVPEGMVHNASFRLAEHFIKQGFPGEVVMKILEGWGPLNEVPAEENFSVMVRDCLRGDYDFGCNDEVLKNFCDKRCYLYKEPSKMRLVMFDDALNEYEQYVRTLSETRFITGYKAVDEAIRGVGPGETMMIIAYSGLFKSAFLQNLMLNASKRTGIHNIFFSLEMPISLVMERSAQITGEEYSFTVENGITDAKYKASIRESMIEGGADKLIICDTPGLTLEDIEAHVEEARRRVKTIGCIGIDYLGLMRAPGKSSEYERISAIAEGSKDLAKRLNIPVIVLSQVGRGAADEEIERWSGKGSGALEASSDFQLGLYREKGTKNLMLKITKNRKGRDGLIFRAIMDKEYLKFRDFQEVTV